MTNPQSTCAAAGARYNKPSELAAELHKPTEFTLFNRLHFVLNNVANIDHLWRYLSTIFTFSYEPFTSALNVIHRSEQFHSFCTNTFEQFSIRPPKNTFVLLVFQLEQLYHIE